MSNLTLMQLYQEAIDKKAIQKDNKQLFALEKLQPLFDTLQKPRSSGLLGFGKTAYVKGAYLYGPVGTGKTYIMDLFYNNLPIKNKMRMHFYRFMKMVHEQLNLLEGKKEPLKILAKSIAAKTRLICFDEFYVKNIVDAMLLGGLFQALYEQDVTFVMTSNVVPNELYKGGLQRDQFIPAIKLIEKNNAIIEVDNAIDYRLGKFDYDRAYYYPEDPDMKEMLLSRFKSLAGSAITYQKTLFIEDRHIATLYTAKKTVWFDFLALCGIPRSQLDYIALAESYPVIFMSGLRQIQKDENDLIVNFIRLIDVLYDANINLIISSKIPLEAIYTQGRYSFEFERAKSRLIEMQSKDYLSSVAS